MSVQAVPCQHIADFYQRKWENHHCIAWQALRLGYREWASGNVSDPTINNLYA